MNRIIKGRPFGNRLSSFDMITYRRSTLNEQEHCSSVHPRRQPVLRTLTDLSPPEVLKVRFLESTLPP